jgi:uncharacterized membrane protein
VIITWQTLRKALVAAAGAAYLAIGYLAAAADRSPLIGVIVGIVPLMAVVVGAAWHSRLRVPALLLTGALALALIVNLEFLRHHVAWLYFIQHVGTMILLGAMFGTTLRSHEGAICSRIACFALRARPDADYLRYTWQVTLAWTVFFAASAMTSVALFFLAPIEVWSAFAILLTPVLLGIMFAGEYLIRRRALPNRPHFSIAETIQAYSNYSRR